MEKYKPGILTWETEESHVKDVCVPDDVRTENLLNTAT
jgi:hypothetical protein